MILRSIILSVVLAAGLSAADWPWRPFEPVNRPPLPEKTTLPGNRHTTEIDAFLAAKQAEKGTHFRAEAPRDMLLRRVYLDLIGLAPTPEEREAFLADPSPEAYEKVVDRLLADPRHGERWGRHWMDIWRYSDWAGWADGKQIRDSQPHIWRWRDWIVESLNADLGYDRMIGAMLAADEATPEDTSALRATGFLVRNYKMLSREQWLEDTVKHTGQAFFGITVGCAKCHDHKTDPLPQTEYYALRAIFEPHKVRLDQIPGQPDTVQDGLARAYDAEPTAPTFFFPRGDERNPDKSHPIAASVPAFLGGALTVKSVPLPASAVAPAAREFVRGDLEKSAANALAAAKADIPATAARLKTLRAVLAVERLEEAGKKDTPEWQAAATRAAAAQRDEKLTTALGQVIKATLNHAEAAAKGAAGSEAAGKALAEAQKALTEARKAAEAPLTTAYTPRPVERYPAESTGRRLAFAKWLTDPKNPLTARVAVNHVWNRHFGAGLVPTVSDFGHGGRPCTHPALLDWLAADFMEHGWSFRRLHRQICLSAAYRQTSADADGAADRTADPDNTTLWHFPSRRLEAEAVRDNLLYLTSGLDLTRGGPELDQNLALTSPRRSLYFRCAAEKQPEFLQVFDGPSVVECYERRPSVMPQQALAMLNSPLSHARAKAAAEKSSALADTAVLVRQAFIQLLSREPTADESAACTAFLKDDSPARRESFFLTLLNHHEFFTLR